VCLPILNDWLSARLLLDRLDAELAGLDLAVDVLWVDDGSTEPRPPLTSRSRS